MRELNEITITKGMANKLQSLGVAVVCDECGFRIPKYPGRYPSKCPQCGAGLSSGYYKLASAGSEKLTSEEMIRLVRENVDPRDLVKRHSSALTEIELEGFSSEELESLLENLDYVLLIDEEVATIFVEAGQKDRVVHLVEEMNGEAVSPLTEGRGSGTGKEPGGCYCPGCGYTTANTQGDSCENTNCPKCGAEMTGSM